MIFRILLAMDGYICASHTEGFSNAILEAMASGLPIVATKVGGNSEIIKNKKNRITCQIKRYKCNNKSYD